MVLYGILKVRFALTHTSKLLFPEPSERRNNATHSLEGQQQTPPWPTAAEAEAGGQ